MDQSPACNLVVIPIMIDLLSSPPPEFNSEIKVQRRLVPRYTWRAYSLVAPGTLTLGPFASMHRSIRSDHPGEVTLMYHRSNIIAVRVGPRASFAAVVQDKTSYDDAQTKRTPSMLGREKKVNVKVLANPRHGFGLHRNQETELKRPRIFLLVLDSFAFALTNSIFITTLPHVPQKLAQPLSNRLPSKMPLGQMLEPSVTESDFMVSCLSDGIRPDGRSFLSTRDIDISFGEELGNCTVTIKGTRVSTSVRATLMPPRSDRPYEGFLQITTDISPMAGIEYDSTGGGANSSARAREVLFDRLIEKAVRRTEAVDREALCVVAGEQVWNVHLTVHLLSDTGAALDAAVLCSMLSLRHFRRPDYSIENGNQVRLYSIDERVPVPLAIHHTPLCVTFAVFNNLNSTTTTKTQDDPDSHLIDPDSNSSIPPSSSTTVALLDPTLLEESLAQSKLTLVLNAQREICVLDKSYGSPVQATLLLELIHIGLRRIQQLTERLEQALKEDAETRVVEVI